MRPISIDLRDVARRAGQRLPPGARDAAGAAGRALAPAGRVVSAVDARLTALDRRVDAPIGAARADRCTLGCAAVVAGVADVVVTANGQFGPGGHPDGVLLLLDVSHPLGPGVVVVRQSLAEGIERDLRPGLPVRVLADPARPDRALVDWAATGALYHRELHWVHDSVLLKWPDPASGPARGAVEVRDSVRGTRALEAARAERGPVLVRTVSSRPTDGHTDGRRVRRVEVDLTTAAGPQRVTLAERVPSLLAPSLVLGAPLVALPDWARPDRTVIDWPATLALPEHRSR